jgi:methionyl-tRNA formyltransferase
MNLLLMAHAAVGLEIFRWLSKHYRNDLSLVVTVDEDDIFYEAKATGIECCALSSVADIAAHAALLGVVFDLGVLAWWPKLIREPVIDLPRQGFVNTHPSLLPYNRGKHYNFWALAEQAPFGVSLHFVDSGVDSGDIIAQQEIPYDWEDTGKTLFCKAQAAMPQLFAECYPRLRSLNVNRQKQDLSRGSFHLATEMDQMCRINLDDSYTARDLLNLVRARTFEGHPACRFTDDDVEYEVVVTIKKVTQ